MQIILDVLLSAIRQLLASDPATLATYGEKIMTLVNLYRQWRDSSPTPEADAALTDAALAPELRVDGLALDATRHAWLQAHGFEAPPAS